MRLLHAVTREVKVKVDSSENSSCFKLTTVHLALAQVTKGLAMAAIDFLELTMSSFGGNRRAKVRI